MGPINGPFALESLISASLFLGLTLIKGDSHVCPIGLARVRLRTGESGTGLTGGNEQGFRDGFVRRVTLGGTKEVTGIIKHLDLVDP